jgi:hypothetical protein
MTRNSPTKLQRWLDLIAYLVGRRLPVAVEELMEKVPAYAEKWNTGEDTPRATRRRTFERDKEELRRRHPDSHSVVFDRSGDNQGLSHRPSRLLSTLSEAARDRHPAAPRCAGRPCSHSGYRNFASTHRAHHRCGRARRQLSVLPTCRRSALRPAQVDLRPEPTDTSRITVLFVERSDAATCDGSALRQNTARLTSRSFSSATRQSMLGGQSCSPIHSQSRVRPAHSQAAAPLAQRTLMKHHL